MASVHDVAKYILREHEESMSTWKLQKLVYYSQAWSLVWDERPMFPEPIEAWANGPVVRKLYNAHKGKFKVGSWPYGKVSELDEDARDTIDAVLDFYGKKSGHWLSELTHSEDPWRDARKGLSPNERGSKRITHGALVDYYGQLSAA